MNSFLETIGYSIRQTHSAMSGRPLILHPHSMAFCNSTILIYRSCWFVYLCVIFSWSRDALYWKMKMNSSKVQQCCGFLFLCGILASPSEVSQRAHITVMQCRVPRLLLLTNNSQSSSLSIAWMGGGALRCVCGRRQPGQLRLEGCCGWLLWLTWQPHGTEASSSLLRFEPQNSGGMLVLKNQQHEI